METFLKTNRTLETMCFCYEIYPPESLVTDDDWMDMDFGEFNSIDLGPEFHQELDDASPMTAYKRFFIIAYYIILIIGIPGNMFVLVMVKFKPLNPQNAFLLTNLSVSSLILLISLPLKIALLNSRDNFNHTVPEWLSSKIGTSKNTVINNGLCKFYLGHTVLCLLATLLTIVAVAADRFIAVRTTKNIILRQKRASWFLALSGAIWLISLFITTPVFYFSLVEDNRCQTVWILESEEQCEQYMSEPFEGKHVSELCKKKNTLSTHNTCEANHTDIEKLYSLFCLGGFILLPMLAVPMLYYCFFSRFKEHTMEINGLSQSKPNQVNDRTSEVKRNVIALSVSVAFTWIPFLVFHLIRFLGPLVSYQINKTACDMFGMATTLLLYLSCLVNPLLYTCFGSTVRKKLVRIVRYSFYQSTIASSNISSPMPTTSFNFHSIRLKSLRERGARGRQRRMKRDSWRNNTISISESVSDSDNKSIS